ncbi:MAG TPA: extracellular solute-binding protein, partial [Chroococcidiopsis sp.]
LSQFLSACGQRAQTTLRVQFLEKSIPTQLLQQFERQLGKQTKLLFSATPQLSALFDQLQRWQQQASEQTPPKGLLPGTSAKPEPIADFVTLGDAWLTPAIQQQLIQPLDSNAAALLQSLPKPWQSLVKRDPQGGVAANGQPWALPYRWGTLVLVYRVSAFEALGWTPTDWDDLWRPELEGRLSLLDNARVVIGLALKRLGQSFNAAPGNAAPGNAGSGDAEPGNAEPGGDRLKTSLTELNRQALFYSSEAYLQPLLLEDTWLAVGWSSDVWPLIKRDRRFAAVVPASGTLLWADLWVRPAGAPPTPVDLQAQWLNFFWDDQNALELSLLGAAVSPQLITADRATLPEGLRSNPLLLPDNQLLEQCEFLQPLPAAIASDYAQLWAEMRQPVVDQAST